MGADIENILLEHLKHIRARVDGLTDDVQDLKRRMTSIESQVAGLHMDFAGQSARLDRIEIRLDRIEQRLGLVEAG